MPKKVTMTPAVEYKPTIEESYWSCGCVIKMGQVLTHVKLNPIACKVCRKCGCSQANYLETLRAQLPRFTGAD